MEQGGALIRLGNMYLISLGNGGLGVGFHGFRLLDKIAQGGKEHFLFRGKMLGESAGGKLLCAG